MCWSRTVLRTKNVHMRNNNKWKYQKEEEEAVKLSCGSSVNWNTIDVQVLIRDTCYPHGGTFAIHSLHRWYEYMCWVHVSMHQSAYIPFTVVHLMPNSTIDNHVHLVSYHFTSLRTLDSCSDMSRIRIRCGCCCCWRWSLLYSNENEWRMWMSSTHV